MDEYIAYDNRMECELEVVRLKIALRIKTEEHNCLTEDFLALRKSEQEGWKESAIAWEVCASIHETWAKKKDAMYSTRHADFERHATDARRKLTTDQTMTDILDLEGWNGIAKHVDGDDYLIEQMREAIRLKDEALDWCIGEFNLRLDDIDLSQETISVLSARHIQPSPEHLEAWYKSMVGEPVAWNYELTEEAFVRLSVAGINVDTPLHAIKPFKEK